MVRCLKSTLLTLMYRTMLLCCALLAAALAPAQDNWKLKSESAGISIYMAPVPGSRVKALKVNCSFDASASQLVAVILDLDACSEWVYHSKSNILVKRVSPAELYYYSEVDIPWPLSNRDFIAHITVSQNKQNKIITVDAPCLPDMVPVKENIVRITHSVGRWTITPVNQYRVNVEYILKLDPGGNVPAWLINMFATHGPMESFKQLKQQLRKPAYRNVHLDFITD